MKKAVVFGSHKHLVGIHNDADQNRPTVLMWNVGVVGRSGPYRQHVELCKALKSKGFPTFRIDVGGRGSSEIRPDITEDFDRSIADVIEAMDYLKENFGSKEFIIYGHCSSAVEGHVVASQRTDVVGLIMIDTYSYRVGKFKTHYYKNRLLSKSRLTAATKNLVAQTEKKEQEGDLFEGFYPSLGQLTKDMDSFISRELPLYVHFTGGFEYIYNYKKQFLDMFPKLYNYKNLELHLQKDADHLMSTLPSRKTLTKQVLSWFDRNFPQEENGLDLNTLISEYFKKNSHLPAIKHGDRSITYQQLDQMTKSFAAKLQKDGIKVGDNVAICLDRSIELIIGVIGILRSGAAYVPCDISYPKPRLEKIMSIAKPKALISDDSALKISEFPELKCYSSETISTGDESANYVVPNLKSNSPAYIIFTSGSTGDPKGVTLGHGALFNLLKWQDKAHPAQPGLKTLQYTPIGFDVSFQEIGSNILGGGCLYILDQAIRLDPVEFLSFINRNEINRLFMPFVALQYLCETSDIMNIAPKSLSDVFSAGEQLQITNSVRKFFKSLPNAILHNHYGPSESHVITAYSLSGDPESWPNLPPIGKVVDENQIHVLDSELKPANQGELYLQGRNLALGYFGRGDLTEKAFIKNDRFPETVYKTGDLVEFDENGDLVYLGRIDSQVKVRGHRIELGDIEVALSKLDQITACCVNPIKKHGVTELVAYLIADKSKVSWSKLRTQLQEILPEYMIPSQAMFLESLPRTPSGKIARRELPEPTGELFPEDVEEDPKNSKIEGSLEDIISAFNEALGIKNASSKTHFFNGGGTSLQAMKLVAILLGKYQIKLAVADLYNHPSPGAIQNHLTGSSVLSESKSRSKGSSLRDGVAVIGMAIKGPGFSDLKGFQDILENGRETLSKFSKSDVHPQVDQDNVESSDYVFSRGMVEDSHQFDHKFFGISPAAARLMDPQQRQLLQEAWHCLEDAGINPDEFSGLCGTYVGVSHNTYYLNNILQSNKVGKAFSAFDAMLANDKDYSATRVAYHLNLKGPAINVQTACSTSLVAIITAARAILAGETDIALAGGSSMTFPRVQGHLFQEGSIYSEDGKCRPFDNNASGTYFSDGVGMVLLKDLDQAIADGDRIYSVIRGAGLNNDGKDKASFSAPHGLSQAFAIKTAMDEAQWSGTDIGYIEAHGTATPIGDPIEISGLEMAYDGANIETPIRIGSLKANMGHLTAAAGVAGFIKASLSVKYGKLFPQINFNTLNKQISLDPSRFTISQQLEEWKSDTRRAAVSSFGVGGTNAHVVLENQAVSPKENSSQNRSILFSAKSQDSLSAQQETWLQFLETGSSSLADIAKASQNKPALAVRQALVAPDINDLKSQIDSGRFIKAKGKESKDLLFAFPGQGSQYLAMGKGFFESNEVFKSHALKISALIEEKLGYCLADLLYSSDESQRAELDLLNDTFYTQPALFLCSYSLAQMLLAGGLKPKSLIGHSIGEIVAATLSGVFTVESAVALICERARLVKKVKEGSMLAASLSESECQEYLSASISLAAVNGPKRTVFAGDDTAIDTLSAILKEKGIQNKKLHTSHAFHSHMMDSMIVDFESFVSKLDMRAPKLPIISTVNAEILSDEQAMSAKYWADHVRRTVRFFPALEKTLTLHGHVALLEVGPRSTLCQLSAPILGSESVAIPCLDMKLSLKGQDENLALETAMAKLWVNHIGKYEKVKGDLPWIPAYAFEGHEHIIEAKLTENIIPNPTEVIKETTMSSEAKIKELIKTDLVEILSESSGVDLNGVDETVEFLDLGLDSLVLTQVSLNLEKKFKTKVSFRQLNDELVCLADLSSYLSSSVDPNIYASQLAAPTAAPVTPVVAESVAISTTPAAVSPSPTATPVASSPATQQIQVPIQYTTPLNSGNHVKDIIQNQINLMQSQLAVLGGQAVSPASQEAATAPTVAAQEAPVATIAPAAIEKASDKKDGPLDEKKNFGAMAKIKRREKVKTSQLQLDTLKKFTEAYNQATAKSKSYSQEHRSYMSDPRVVTGFKPNVKEITYPIVVNKSQGSTVYDIDGRRYVDMLNGFGSNYYGYQAPFLKDAIQRQMENGYEIGPQHELVGDLSRRVSKMLGLERVAWCNTGSEAVLGAMRMARTVTGREKIITFANSYHGICDEVIVRKGLKSAMPAAPGIMKEAVENIVTLDYGTDEALAYIKEHAHEVAAVLMEPVQSRRPEFRPVEFWKEVRKITKETDTALILDEVITGFRYHQAGVNGAFNVDADIVTYGKIIGGGMPVGMIGGKAKYLDSLDGGSWQYGDDSVPEVGVTYFAGTFVRHPLAMAAAYATIKKMEELGQNIHDEVNAKADYLAKAINDFAAEHKLPYRWENFGSLMKFKVTDSAYQYADLLAHFMRLKGVHIWDGFPTFTSVAHTQEDLDFVIRSFKEAVAEMAKGGLLSLGGSARDIIIDQAQYFDGTTASYAPGPGAILVKDERGYPAWFKKDAQGKLVKYDS